MITVQIRGSGVAVRLFLLEFSNTEGRPYVTVYSRCCLWTGWGTELVSLVPLLTGDWEVKTEAGVALSFAACRNHGWLGSKAFMGDVTGISVPGGFH